MSNDYFPKDIGYVDYKSPTFKSQAQVRKEAMNTVAKAIELTVEQEVDEKARIKEIGATETFSGRELRKDARLATALTQQVLFSGENKTKYLQNTSQRFAYNKLVEQINKNLPSSIQLAPLYIRSGQIKGGGIKVTGSGGETFDVNLSKKFLDTEVGIPLDKKTRGSFGVGMSPFGTQYRAGIQKKLSDKARVDVGGFITDNKFNKPSYGARVGLNLNFAKGGKVYNKRGAPRKVKY